MKVLRTRSMSLAQKSFMCRRGDIKFSDECVGTVTWKIYFVITLLDVSLINFSLVRRLHRSTRDRFFHQIDRETFQRNPVADSPKMCFSRQIGELCFMFRRTCWETSELIFDYFTSPTSLSSNANLLASRFITGDKILLLLRF